MTLIQISEIELMKNMQKFVKCIKLGGCVYCSGGWPASLRKRYGDKNLSF